jgi:ribosome maturation factor RimP
MGMGDERSRVLELVQQVVEGQGYELVDVEFKGAGNKSLLRVYIDKLDGISHEDCELVSEQVGTVLDVEDLIPFSYTLEVSSPGLDRKLFKDADYIRFAGKLAKIQTRIPLEHQKVFRGRLRGLQEGKILLELPTGSSLEIPLDVVQEARLEFDWDEEKARAKS